MKRFIISLLFIGSSMISALTPDCAPTKDQKSQTKHHRHHHRHCDHCCHHSHASRYPFSKKLWSKMYWIEKNPQDAMNAWNKLDAAGKKAFEEELDTKFQAKHSKWMHKGGAKFTSPTSLKWSGCLSDEDKAQMYYGTHCEAEFMTKATEAWNKLSNSAKKKFKKETYAKFEAKHKEWMDKCKATCTTCTSCAPCETTKCATSDCSTTCPTPKTTAAPATKATTTAPAPVSTTTTAPAKTAPAPTTAAPAK